MRFLTCNPELISALAKACEGESVCFKIGRIATVHNAVLTRSARGELHAKTGAHAVDMESHALGIAAIDLGVPFAALRVISDDLNAPELPQPEALKNFWRKPSQLHKKISVLWRWYNFINDFRKSLKIIDSILTRMIRCQ